MSRELIGNKGKLPAGRRESCKQPLSGDLQGPLVAFSADRATCLLFMQFSNLLRLRGVYGFMQIALGALGQWRCASDACRRRAAESAASAASVRPAARRRGGGAAVCGPRVLPSVIAGEGLGVIVVAGGGAWGSVLDLRESVCCAFCLCVHACAFGDVRALRLYSRVLCFLL